MGSLTGRVCLISFPFYGNDGSYLFLLYYNFCLWNYVKELIAQKVPGTHGREPYPHLRLQRYDFSAKPQNNQRLFLKNIQQHEPIHYLLYIKPGGLGVGVSETETFLFRSTFAAGIIPACWCSVLLRRSSVSPLIYLHFSSSFPLVFL